jgi:uncharacterized membrane protein
MRTRLVWRLLTIVALSWGLAELIELAPPAWKAFAAWFPPTIITLLVAFAFARSLFHGEALITRIARANHPGGLPEELVGYTRHLTTVWAWYMAGVALLTAMLGLYTDFSHPGLLAPVMVTGLLGGEYLYRIWRFRHHHHRNPLSVLWFMLQHGMPRD